MRFNGKSGDVYIGKRPRKSPVLKGIFYLGLAGILCAGIFLGAVYHQVSREAGTRIQRGAIQQIIFSESPVYFDDEITPIGVFFEKTHRRYIHFDDIPKSFVKAIVAAEDHRFFEHMGFDPKAILRAFVANFRTGHVVQGGSTITQQTAKNIFKREQRSYKAKLKELFQAILLEQRYSKEEILELYANQFFVSGFGRGLQIAARYFFDKDAQELDLVESAFIAGSVKGPNRYTPFIKQSAAEKERAQREADARKDYVLRSMLKLQFITADQFREAIGRSVPFREGRITYRLNVVLDYIREQLENPLFQEILSREGIENIATSGIRIYTSINQDMQEGALEALRNQLPLLDIQIRGYDPAQEQDRYQALTPPLATRPTRERPFLARIRHVEAGTENPHLVVAWDDGTALVDLVGMEEIGEAWVRSRRGPWASFGSETIAEFMKGFREGDLIPVRFRKTDRDRTEGLSLTQIPEMDGGVLVLQEGMIRAMAGGYFNRFFNRAVDAKRQLGSTFKPFVYAAALQLKWNSLDSLMNEKELFRFGTTSYVPNPDHTPRSADVSMAWAGVKSENLATVWLLYHLTDRLNLGEFREVVQCVGLDRHKDEPYEEYVRRIRDDHGVIVDQDAVMEAAFHEARKSIESDLIFAGYTNVLTTLRRLHFRIPEEGLDLRDPDHRRIYRFNYERLQAFDRDMKESLGRIRNMIDQGITDSHEAELRWFRMKPDGEGPPHLVYLGPRLLGDGPDLVQVSMSDFQMYPELLEPRRVWVDGLVPSHVLDLLQQQTVRNYRELVDQKRYDLELLFRIRDFRVLVNLHYVCELARRMGVATPIDPVLSFPLGANAISIAEAARAYQTMMCGEVYPLHGDLGEDMIPVIRRIEDRDGEVIWEYAPRPEPVIGPRVSGMISDILRQVVENGTGKRARDAVRLSVDVSGEITQIPVPAFGKTGTANRYTNSSFVGFLPGPADETGGLEIRSGYVISAYVGYDDNRPMKTDRMTIYGSSGALPVWIDTANALVNSRTYRKNLQIADLAFEWTPGGAIEDGSALRPVYISSISGLPIRGPKEGPSGTPALILSDVEVEDGTVVLNRQFDPLK